MKVIIFGTGSHFQKWKHTLPKGYEIVAFADNNKAKIGTYYENKEVIAPDSIPNNKYDKVIISSVYKYQMLNQLIDIGIEDKKIDFLFCYSSSKNYNMETVVDCKERSVILTIDGLKFKCKTEGDFYILNEIFSGVYNFNSNRDEMVVIDIGMNIGIASIYFAGRSNIKKIYGFEPFKATYEQAVNNINLNNQEIIDKIEPYNLALGNENVDRNIAYNPNASGDMSVLSENSEAEQENTETIHLKDASEIIRKIITQNEKATIILKSDCEGSEYDIFNSLESNKLFDKIDIIMMEWHLARAAELEEILIRNNFEFFNFGFGQHQVGYIYAYKIK
ncbi:MAG: FkbM family methyltransferase [Anaerocolumna sp.]|nr:FkbM family methyltransferase [Anaerocolumna sp.]